MKPLLSEKDLKAIVSSAVRRQHLLGAMPGAQRLLPLGALALGDWIVKNSKGDNVIESLLCAAGPTQIQLQSPEETITTRQVVKDSTVAESCLSCSRIRVGNTGIGAVRQAGSFHLGGKAPLIAGTSSAGFIHWCGSRTKEDAGLRPDEP